MAQKGVFLKSDDQKKKKKTTANPVPESPRRTSGTPEVPFIPTSYMTLHEVCSYPSPKSSFPRSISLAFCFSLVSFRNQRSRNRIKSSSRFARETGSTTEKDHQKKKRKLSGDGFLLTGVCRHDDIGPAERAGVLLLPLHLYHAADAEDVMAL